MTPDPLIPNIGVNMQDFMSEAATTMGAVIAVAVGITIAVLLVVKGVKWLRRGLAG